MAIKNVVKVMNFHSLLRVDKARRRAAIYFDTEEELMKIIRKIFLNKNIILDKKIIEPLPDAAILNIYIGNDLGFCGDFNFLINKEVRRDSDTKIIIGKKIHSFDHNNVLLYISKEAFFKDFSPVENIIYDGIEQRKYKEINVIYNHYYNINKQEFKKKRLFPFDYEDEGEGETFDEDFAMETEIGPMLNNLISLFICYELKISEMNSYAAENVVRQQITRQSLKKIDEMDAEKARVERKTRKQKEFQKLIDSYR